eukprot:3076919-Pyramimonas_sp.AAC.1
MKTRIVENVVEAQPCETHAIVPCALSPAERAVASLEKLVTASPEAAKILQSSSGFGMVLKCGGSLVKLSGHSAVPLQVLQRNTASALQQALSSSTT